MKSIPKDNFTLTFISPALSVITQKMWRLLNAFYAVENINWYSLFWE